LTNGQADNRVLIVGGGIGGLAAATALQRAGVEVAVFEQSGELHEVGAGVGLQLAAVKALKRIGMLERIMEVSSEPIQALELRNYRSGKLLAKLPQGEVGGDAGLFGLNIHRGDLLATFAKSAGSDVVTLEAECVGFEQDDRGVTARFADGREERGAALVGADGIHSTVRRQLHGDTPLRYSGYTVWRSMPPFKDSRLSDGYPQQAVGPGGGFGLHPRDELLYWFASMARPEGAPDPPEGKKHELRRLYSDWYPPIPDVIEATPEEQIFRGDIYDRAPLDRWGEGRVTLLGDAAHATTPALGQGAGMTIEDAAVLAEELALEPGLERGDRIAAALSAYEGRRRPRTAAIVSESYRLSKTYNWKNPVACKVREGVMRLRPERTWRKAFRAEVERDL
jgi:2-polyprenyl-6-methoxyphenol hydroxylase-like FAD-dependent oxidoreductase